MNNKITISGEIADLKYSHSFDGENFYVAILESKRRSGTLDHIPVVISQLLLAPHNGPVIITGSIRTRNTEGHIVVYAFANTLDPYVGDPVNDACLYGTVCRIKPTRKTPNGRIITDMTVAVHRGYLLRDVSDYLPVVCWGESDAAVGSDVIISGRLQSRDYISQKTGLPGRAIEISVAGNNLEIMK